MLSPLNIFYNCQGSIIKIHVNLLLSYTAQDYRWANNFFCLASYILMKQKSIPCLLLFWIKHAFIFPIFSKIHQYVWNIFSYMNAENKHLKLNRHSEEKAKCFWHKLLSFPATILSSKSWLLHVICFGYTILLCNFNHDILWSLRTTILLRKDLVLPYLKGRGIHIVINM